MKSTEALSDTAYAEYMRAKRNPGSERRPNTNPRVTTNQPMQAVRRALTAASEQGVYVHLVVPASRERSIANHLADEARRMGLTGEWDIDVTDESGESVQINLVGSGGGGCVRVWPSTAQFHGTPGEQVIVWPRALSTSFTQEET